MRTSVPPAGEEPLSARMPSHRLSPPYFTAFPIRFWSDCESAALSTSTSGRSSATCCLDSVVSRLNREGRLVHRGLDDVRHVLRLEIVALAVRLPRGELQRLLDHAGQTSALVANQSAVLRHLFLRSDHSIRQISPPRSKLRPEEFATHGKPRRRSPSATSPNVERAVSRSGSYPC